MNVEVKLLGVFRQSSKKDCIVVKLEDPATIAKVIRKLTQVFSSEFKRALIDPELEDPRPNALILVNGKEISALKGLATNVNSGDEIVLVPVTHGG